MCKENKKNFLLLLLYGTPYILFLAFLATKYSIFQSIRTPPFEMPLLQEGCVLIFFALYYSLSFPLLKNIRHASKKVIDLVFLLFIISIIVSLFIKPLFSQDQYWNLLLSKGYVRF